MQSSQIPLTVGMWLLTYALHSTVFLGGLWLLLRIKWIKSIPLKEALWKFALLGGLVSATLQLGFGIEPLSGRFQINSVLTGDAAAANPSSEEQFQARHNDPPSAERGKHPIGGTNREGHSHAGHFSDARLPLATGVNDGPWPAEWEAASIAGKGSKASLLSNWPWVLLSLFAVTAAFSLISLAGAWVNLKRMLKGRVDLIGGALPTLLDRLCSKKGMRRAVRLTCSSRLSVPIAIGILRPEICLPLRALSELKGEEQESMLAHELAHLARNDPAWLTFFRILECLFFFQPLNRLGRHCWLELTEYHCDTWAVALLGGGLPLARCLAEVAGWTVSPQLDLRNAAAHSMARNPSLLTRRVKRILNEPPGGKSKYAPNMADHDRRGASIIHNKHSAGSLDGHGQRNANSGREFR